MKRKDYIDRLEQLLLVLPWEEREEALQYYNDYFEDAGIENEEKVILELGSPEEVAAKIRAGYAGEHGEYSEQGFEDARFHYRQDIVTEAERVEGTWEKVSGEETPVKSKKTRNQNTNVWKVIAIIFLVLFAAPIILSIGIALVAVVAALLLSVLAVLGSVGIAGFAVLVAGIIVIAAGIAKTFLNPPVGILAIGIGCILLAVGALLSWIIITVLVKTVPPTLRAIVNFLGTPFRKAGGK